MKASGHVLITALVFALIGCSGPDREAPAAERGIPLPPRPQEIPIDGLDPCSVFTDDQLSRLDVGGERYTAPSGGRGAVCQWRHSPAEPIEGYGVAIVADFGPAEFVGQLKGRSIVTTVAGFPAIVTDQVPAGLPVPEHCSVVVGVAEGQSLQIAYDYNGTELKPTIEQSCAKARTAAEMAMDTLIDRAGGGR
jgi:hypothetical protein